MTSQIHTRLLTAATASLLLLLAGCGREPDSVPAAAAGADTREAQSATTAMGASPSGSVAPSALPPGERIDDVQIVSGIKAQFAADRDISAMAIDVDSKEGMVTLSGTVTNSDAKVRADRIAKQMRDVKSVNNHLEVKAG